MFRGLKRYTTAFNKRLTQRCSIETCGTPLGVQQPLAKVVRDDKFIPNNIYEGFICKDAKYVHDFNMTAYLFEHERVKTPFLHIDRNDPNNLFSIGFRTTPYDSSGLPHILEHLSLCGSQKFPVRDPFFKMTTRSVATFMNAMTGPDYTIYPFSSMNETDFRHLQMIYLDAVFKPNLNYLDFLQEGWRLENIDLDNPQSNYIIKGVVYNEMKGSYSEISNYFVTKFMNKMLPDHTYQYCSGGDPANIPGLTHANLVEFHRKYYHPSNARFFSYGNFDPLTSMRFINTQYLNSYQPIDDRFSAIPQQKRWTSEKVENISCRYDNIGAPIERQNQIAIGYLLSDIQDVYETLLLNVISELLVKGPNSRFYKNLIEPNISGGYSPITGFESTIRDTLFVVGLQDVEAKDFDKIQQIFNKTIDEVIDQGFDKEHVASVLNNFELSLKHQAPKFGLGLLFSVFPIWMHGGDAIGSLQYSQLFGEINENLRKNPKYLQEKVKQYFKDNKHRLVMTVMPDLEHEKKQTTVEENMIAEKVAGLTPDIKQKLFRDCNELAKNQKKQENINVLPCLTLDDVKTPPATYKLEHATILNVSTQICRIDTNNVTYLNGIFSASELSHGQKMLLPLLANIVDQMGTKNVDYRTFDKQLNLYTSGIRFKPIFQQNVQDLSKFQVNLAMMTYCLDQNIPKMFDLVQELLKKFNFDDITRFEMLLKNYQSALSVGIVSAGHLYAMMGARGLVTEAQHLRTRIEGLEHVEFVKNLIEKTPPAAIQAQLHEMATILFDRSNFKVALNTPPATAEKCLKEYYKFLQQYKRDHQCEADQWENSNACPKVNVHNVMTIPVNYCAKAILAVPYTHSDFSPLRVVSKILSAKYLLPVVREQNGAYGAGVTIDENGMLSFFSYRDPNTVKTLDTFDSSASWLKGNWNLISDQVLFEAKLGLLQKLDEPIGPGAKGIEYFRSGISQEMLRQHRQQVLAVTHDDLSRVIELYLSNTDLPCARYILGPKNESLNDGWTIKHS